MAEGQQAIEQQGRGKGFMKELATVVVRKTLEPLVATAVTAGTVYATRKGTEIWQERVLPKVREQGGGKAVAKETLEKICDRVGGRVGEPFSALARHLVEEPRARGLGAEPPSVPEATAHESDGPREEQRRQRQQRRQQRQRALEQSGST
jgi:hypothetical protein